MNPNPTTMEQATPYNKGKTWNVLEDQELLNELKQSVPHKQIATNHHRSIQAIKIRIRQHVYYRSKILNCSIYQMSDELSISVAELATMMESPLFEETPIPNSILAYYEPTGDDQMSQEQISAKLRFLKQKPDRLGELTEHNTKLFHQLEEQNIEMTQSRFSQLEEQNSESFLKLESQYIKLIQDKLAQSEELNAKILQEKLNKLEEQNNKLLHDKMLELQEQNSKMLQDKLIQLEENNIKVIQDKLRELEQQNTQMLEEKLRKFKKRNIKFLKSHVGKLESEKS